jgi:thioredoxin 1
MSQVMRFTDHNFNQEVSQCETPTLVEFSASWCVPSQQEKPVLKELAKGYDGSLKIGELNVDQNPLVASKFQIMGCPTFIIFNSGNVVQRRTGAQSQKQLQEMIQSAVNQSPVAGLMR